MTCVAGKEAIDQRIRHGRRALSQYSRRCTTVPIESVFAAHKFSFFVAFSRPLSSIIPSVSRYFAIDKLFPRYRGISVPFDPRKTETADGIGLESIRYRLLSYTNVKFDC